MNTLDCLFQLGICILYDKVLPITKSLYEALHITLSHYKIFLPTNLKKGSFAVSAKGNINKNALSNLFQSHFHSTGISLFQLLDHENQGESLVMDLLIQFATSKNQLRFQLNRRNQVRFIVLEELFAPLCRFNYKDLLEYPEVNLAKTEEYKWLQQFSGSVNSAKS